MTRIRETKKYTIVLTEQTILELTNAVNQAKEQPGVDVATVSSQWSNVEFEIKLEVLPRSQESLGYKLSSTGGVAQSPTKELKNKLRDSGLLREDSD